MVDNIYKKLKGVLQIFILEQFFTHGLIPETNKENTADNIC